MPIESVMSSNHLKLCHPLLLLPPIPPNIKVFSNESTLCMRWPKYWSFSFSIIPSKEHPGLISIRALLLLGWAEKGIYFFLMLLFLCFIRPGIFRTSSLGDSISSNPERTALRRQGDDTGHIEVLQQRAGSQNIKWLLLIKENQIFQVKELIQRFFMHGKTQGDHRTSLPHWCFSYKESQNSQRAT